jgi:hypothetical protein
MALSQEDRLELREIIADNMKGLNARVEAQNDIIESKVDGINNRLDKLNGKVNKHEDIINESKMDRQAIHEAISTAEKYHAATCPVLPRIVALETDKTVRFSFKQAIVMIVTVISLLVGTTYTIIKINEGRREKDIKTIVTPLEKEIQDLKIK